jgi:glycogen(starch) synthase
MKVLFWSEQYLPAIGGVEVWGAGLMRTLASRGYSFAVVTCKPDRSLPDEETIDGVEVYRFPFHPPIVERDLLGMRRLCGEISALKKRLDPDLIHMNTTLPSIFYHVHTTRGDDRPTVVTMHSPPLFLDGTPQLFTQLVRAATVVTAVSDATRRQLIRAVPGIDDWTETVYNGLDAPDLQPAPLPFDPVHIVCAGRIVEDKGFDVALKAFRLFLDRHPNARMTIAGDGPKRRDLEILAADLGISDSVTFAGWIDRVDIPAMMNTSTMVLMPSRWEEPFGLVALQAAQVGRPVVATQVGGLPEVVIDGETGILVESEDPERMCSSMTDLAGNPELAARLGARARLRALTEFTMVRCADRYDEVYRRAVETTRSV